MQTVEQQIANLRPTVRSGLASNLHKWMIGIALLLVIISIVLWHPVPLMFAVFFGIVGISERHAGPNVAAAIKAFDTKVPTHGMVSITITSWDVDKTYHALVVEHKQPNWKFQFIPQGWQPVEGNYPIKIWRLDNKKPPVLVATEQGLIIPRYNPELSE